MRRFFIKVGEAVELIQTAIAHIEELQGTVLTRAMKAVQIGDLLELYAGQRGASWERIGGRPGERHDEYIVGEMELPYTPQICVRRCHALRDLVQPARARADRRSHVVGRRRTPE